MAGPIFTPELIAHYAQQIEPEQSAAHTPAKPDASLYHKVGLPALLGGQGADLATTLYGLSHGATESNPILGGSPARITATKAAMTAGLAYLTHRMSKTSPKAALITALLGGAAGAIPAAMNVRTLTKK